MMAVHAPGEAAERNVLIEQILGDANHVATDGGRWFAADFLKFLLDGLGALVADHQADAGKSTAHQQPGGVAKGTEHVDGDERKSDAGKGMSEHERGFSEAGKEP